MRRIRILGVVLASAIAGMATAQPVCQAQRLMPDDTSFLTGFGYSVATSGEWALVGAQGDDTNGANAGAAYIFRFDGVNWIQTQKILAPDGTGGDRFGDFVSLDRDVAAVGARLHFHEDNPGRGAVYIYRKKGDEWVFEQEMTPPGDFDQFGIRLAVSGDRLAVVGTFKLHVFRFTGTVWVMEQQLIDGINFTSVAIDGDIIVAGAPVENILGCDPKETLAQTGGFFAFHYDRDSGEWGEPILLVPATVHCNQRLGWAVAIDGTTAIASTQSPRAAHIFEFNPDAGTWSETATIEAGFDPAFLNWGFRPASIAIEGDTAIVGASSSWLTGSGRGAAFIFRRTAPGQWMHRTTVLPQVVSGSSAFGWSVSISGERAIIGAPLESNLAGAAYLFDLEPPPGDLNCDGRVDEMDLLQLLSDWGPCPPPGQVTHFGCPADLNSDGRVDVRDLLILLRNWG